MGEQAFKREIMIRTIVADFLIAYEINYFKKHINDNIFLQLLTAVEGVLHLIIGDD